MPTITASVDTIANKLAPGVPPVTSGSLVKALDRVGNSLPSVLGLSQLAVGPNEEVYLLNATGLRKLHSFPPGPGQPPDHILNYYDLVGTFTDLTGRIPGQGEFESVLSWFKDEVGPIVLNFPDPSLAGPPYNQPPANGYAGVTTGGETLGVTKTRIEFPNGDSLVSIGVNQTKIALKFPPGPTSNAQLFETNTEVISTGTGRFANAKGLITSDLGYFFEPLVPVPDPSVEPFKSGYKAQVFIFIRLITQLP